MLEAIALAAAVPGETVRRAFMLSGRLPDTALAALTGGEPALRAIGLELGRPIRPMLASPADSLDDALAELGPDVLVDHKLDGARIQLHRAGDRVAVFTRSLRNITPAVPELVELALTLPGRRLVLDGEALSIDDDGRPLLFQDSMSNDGGGTQRAFFFDCLHLDGADLIDEPLATRLDALDRAAGAHRMPGTLRPDPATAAELLDGALAAGHEGVMVKSLDAPYAAGRRGRAWLKVKPVHTLDLVVLGAEWGYGRRTGYLSNIHLGARDPSTGESDTAGESFVMVGKTFKGMTDELLAWQTQTFPALQRAAEGHVVYLRPELVVEIELDGVQRSTRYPGGVALRFARVLRYRPDKTAEEADTIETVRRLLLG
jgi:DNA ligase-1